jgi:hypothetical protein
MKGRLWEWTSLFMGAQLGNLEWAHLPGTFELWLKGALEVECLPLRELYIGNLEGGLRRWGPWRIGRKGSLSIRTPFGEPGGGLVYLGL